MLNRYYIDASSLSAEARENIYSDLERKCFLVNMDLRHTGCYEVFLEDTYDLGSLVTFPDSCVVTRL